MNGIKIAMILLSALFIAGCDFVVGIRRSASIENAPTTLCLMQAMQAAGAVKISMKESGASRGTANNSPSELVKRTMLSAEIDSNSYDLIYAEFSNNQRRLFISSTRINLRYKGAEYAKVKSKLDLLEQNVQKYCPNLGAQVFTEDCVHC